MWILVRRVSLGAMGIAALTAFLPQAAFGQLTPPSGGNPYAAVGRNTTYGLSGGPAGGLLGYGAPGQPGYGSLSASYANPGLGYGSLMNSGGGGGSSSAGYGMYGTQWMMNPYQGYLSGAADITRANADFQGDIQQARLLREEARRSRLQTRRAMIEEALWEREHMPDPEKIRQQALAKELAKARVSPPLVDIVSARSLNALLRYLIAQQGQGVRGPAVPLNEELLKQINLTIGNSRGNVGLLRDGGKLEWPLTLKRGVFAEARQGLNKSMETASQSLRGGLPPTNSNIGDLRAHLEEMQKILDANVDLFSMNELTEASRYLREVKYAIVALKDPNVANFFSGNWVTDAKNVADLVRFMREKGLWFAPATRKDTAAYRSLYSALAQFDYGMQRVAQNAE